MNTYIADFQGYGGFNSGFIVKEVAVYHAGHHHHFIVSPPFDLSLLSKSLRKQTRWLFKNHHGLTWKDGFTSFPQIKKFLRNKIQNGVVYVKGTGKAQWLRELLLNENIEVINLEDIFNCPNLRELRNTYPYEMKCQNHEKFCALQNVYLLHKFINFPKQK